MRQATAATTAATASAAAATVRASTFGSRTFSLDELSFHALFCPCFPLFPGWGKDIKLQKLVCLIAFVFLSLMVQCGGDGDDKRHLAFVWVKPHWVLSLGSIFAFSLVNILLLGRALSLCVLFCTYRCVYFECFSKIVVPICGLS